MNIRWMTRKDFPAVLRIESESFEFPWTDAELHAWQGILRHD